MYMLQEDNWNSVAAIRLSRVMGVHDDGAAKGERRWFEVIRGSMSGIEV